MKHLNLIVLLMFFSTAFFAQDLHIYYDLQTQTPRYVVDSQVVKRPVVRQGANIILHLEQYNNYLYDVVIEQKSTEIRLPSSVTPSALSSIFPTLGKNASDFLSLTDSRGGFLLGDKTTEDRGDAPTSFDASLGISRAMFQELTRSMETFNQTLQKMQAITAEIDNKRQEVQSLVESHQVNALIFQEIEKIKFDPALKPDQIKRMTKEYMCKALNLPPTQENLELNLDSLLRKGNTRAQLVTLLETVKEKHDDFREEKARLNSVKETLNSQFSDNLLIQSQYLTPTVQLYDQTSTQEEEITDMENKLLQLVTELPEVDISKLAALWREYEALQANTFSKNYRAGVDGDQITFNIQFTPNEIGQSNKAPRMQMAPIEVAVAGGFKVNASIGVAFGQLFDRPQSYFVRDSIIRAEDKDSFLPIIASFFHFYGQSKGNISFGGNFGIGLPISGDSGQSASFFLGPSLIIGRGERLVLNGGLMGTRVERLAQGFEVGDRFQSEVNNVPTKDVYEMGYYLGLSFNILGGNQ